MVKMVWCSNGTGGRTLEGPFFEREVDVSCGRSEGGIPLISHIGRGDVQANKTGKLGGEENKSTVHIR